MCSSSVTYQSIVAYDGTLFEGFQRQTDGHRTVQGSLEKALRAIGWQGQAIKAAGRTDTGVHAQGQVIAFDLQWDHHLDDLTAALNANLPGDVAVRKTMPAQADFHPRFDAVRRTYRYSIFIDPVRDPLRERYAWRLARALDPEGVTETARLFEGEHDFRAFGRPPRMQSSSIRTVYVCQWADAGDRYELHIEADAFLYHMVRHIAAALVDVGSRFTSLSSITALLDDPTQRRQGRLAPAAGLCLMKVTYDE